jgi:hypothetical protein
LVMRFYGRRAVAAASGSITELAIIAAMMSS